ncbi:MAG: GNAT family N-acetyltransferase [Actinomycetota bacterium]|nr:GNAT family N-acetyltransferase [Actinomycetota bacterium]
MNVDIRQAAAEDVEAILDVLEPVVAEGRWLGVEPPLDRAERRQRFLASLDTGRSVQLLAVVDGEIVGHLGLELAPYGVAQLGMYVAAQWRGRGVGTALVHAAVGTARLMGAHKLSLQVWPHNRGARRLYQRHGFVEEGRLRRHYRRRNGQLWDAVIMGLVLDEQSEGSPYADA